MKKIVAVIFLLILVCLYPACNKNTPSDPVSNTPTATHTLFLTETMTGTPSDTATVSQTITSSATATLTGTITSSATVTVTKTITPLPSATSVTSMLLIDDFDDNNMQTKLFPLCNTNSWGFTIAGAVVPSFADPMVSAGGYCLAVSGTIKTDNTASAGHYAWTKSNCSGIGINVSALTSLKLDAAVYGDTGSSAITYYIAAEARQQVSPYSVASYSAVITANTGWQAVSMPISSFSGNIAAFKDIWLLTLKVMASSSDTNQIVNFGFFMDNVRFE